MPDIPLTEAEVRWVRSYADEVLSVFGDRFRGQGSRLEGFDRPMARFGDAIEAVLTNGRSRFRWVDEAHNELCIGGALAANAQPQFSMIQYEPPLVGTGKTIDFRAAVAGGEHQVFVDVKTMKPVSKDRWDQFQTAQDHGWLPKNVGVVLSPQWCGGEIWHDMFAARSRMLRYSIECEQKIRDGLIPQDCTTTVLVFCGDGVHWTEDQLEDFVAFYRTGVHRADDPFSNMELDYITERSIALDRTIHRFAYMERAQFQVDHAKLNWNVRPPDSPFGEAGPG